jgi:hypothetical protein
VWVSPAVLLLGGWRALELAPDGVSPANALLPRLEGRGPLGAYYGILAEELALAGYAVSWPHLDWRQTIALCAARLVDAIRAYAPAGAVSLVAHSRGGLVVRQALHLLAGAGELGLVRAVVALGTPHQGSWAAAQLLGGWDDTIANLVRLLSLFPSPLSLGAGAIDLLRVVRTWPSAYELLPRIGATWTDAEDTGRCYDAGQWAYPDAAVSPAWLAAAAARWQSLPPIDAAVSWYDVVGYGLQTPVRITEAPVGKRGVRLEPAGDGVVAEGSARQPARVSVRVPVAHGAMPYDGRAIGAAVACLRGQVKADQTVE